MDALEHAKQELESLRKMDPDHYFAYGHLTIAEAQASATIALAEQAKRIADALDRLEVYDGAITARVYNFDGERYA